MIYIKDPNIYIKINKDLKNYFKKICSNMDIDILS